MVINFIYFIFTIAQMLTEMYDLFAKIGYILYANKIILSCFQFFIIYILWFVSRIILPHHLCFQKQLKMGEYSFKPKLIFI
jgi:hypothetical protein